MRIKNRQIAGLKFRRQHPVGPYIADFACIECGLIIELDGGQHSQSIEQDQDRTEYIQRQGFHVVRFWNNDVLLHIDTVLEEILRHTGRSHIPSPPLGGEG